MKLKQKIKSLFEQITKSKVYRLLPLGNDQFYDIRRKFKVDKMDTIFDVGANIGQSSFRFLDRFPNAKIYCFEPSNNTFSILKENLEKHTNVSLFNMALGNEKRSVSLVTSKSSDRNRVLRNGEEFSDSKDYFLEEVEMETLSGFCEVNEIKHIDYLKIDTEGYDLEVLKSGEKLLKERTIDFIEAEVGMNKNNEIHVPVEEIKQYMESYDYYIFGIYEQNHEWTTGKLVLRRVNMIFVSPNLV